VRFALPRRDLALAGGIAAPMAVNNYLINAAFAEIPVPLVVLIFYTWPAITTLAIWLLHKQRPRRRTSAGLILAFIGVALALNVDFTAAQMRGVAFALGASVTWSIVFLLMGHFWRGRDTRMTTFYMAVVALVVFAAACAVTGAVHFPRTAAAWAGLAAVGPFYAFALIGVFAATARLGPARVGFYMNFEPVAAVLLAAAILGQTLAPVQLAGAALVTGALFLFRSGRA
jgi:drug/metabolite transporter (DMT)-like permease